MVAAALKLVAILTLSAVPLAGGGGAPASGPIQRNRSEPLYPALAESTEQMRAPIAWNFGFTGSGQSIAVIDTGVDVTHPMLAGRVRAEACFTDAPGACPNGLATQIGPGAALPCAGANCGHGTHVASVAAGAAAPGGPSGVAPGASIIAIQVFSQTAAGPITSPQAVARALEWLYTVRAEHQIAAVNISISSGSAERAPCADDAGIDAAIARLRGRGIATVIAAGNQRSLSGISYPACVAAAVSVGSASSAYTSLFSNRGPTTTLLAPGEAITAAGAGGGLLTQSGTSAAAPHVAGALALLREREPGRDVGELIAVLSRTSEPMVDLATNLPAPAGLVRLDRALDDRHRLGPGLAESVIEIDPLRVRPGFIDVVGYVVDHRSVLPAEVIVSIDGAPTLARADQPGRAIQGYGADHAFALAVPLTGGRPREVCLSVRGARDAVATRVRCESVEGPAGSPFGALDAARWHPLGLRVQGWAIDPDTSDAVEVHLYTAEQLVRGVLSDRARVDVGRVYEAYGNAHGFDSIVPMGPGTHTVCAYAVNRGVGGNALIGCLEAEVLPDHPIGALDALTDGAGGVVVEGWSLDGNTDQPITVHVYVDGQLRLAALADGHRSDLAWLFPNHGASHYYGVFVPDVGPGQIVCVYGINSGAGSNALIGCRAR